MRVLVTGHAGYLGQAVVADLAEAGHEVGGLDLGCAHQPGDVCERLDVWGALGFAGGAPDAVVHLAALASPARSLRGPLPCWRTNVGGTINLLACLTEIGFQGTFVLASSCAAHTPAASPYGASKAAAESVCLTAAKAHGFRAVCLRLYNLAGGRDSNHHRLIPSLVRAAALDLPFRLHAAPASGGQASEGGCVRDYIHVHDAARAFRLALTAPLGRGEGAVLDIGSGDGRRTADVIRAVAHASGRPIAVQPAPPRPGDPPAAIADTVHARHLLGWQATHWIDDIAADAWRNRPWR